MFGIMSFEPSRDHRTARAAGRAAAFPVLNESAPLSGRFTKDRPYLVVCRQLSKPMAGTNQLFRRRVEVCCTRPVDRLELSDSI